MHLGSAFSQNGADFPAREQFSENEFMALIFCAPGMPVRTFVL